MGFDEELLRVCVCFPPILIFLVDDLFLVDRLWSLFLFLRFLFRGCVDL